MFSWTTFKLVICSVAKFLQVNIFKLGALAGKVNKGLLTERESIMSARRLMLEVAQTMINVTKTDLHVYYADEESKLAYETLDTSKGVVYIANHQSNFDIPMLEVALDGTIGFVAKKDMENWPLFPKIMLAGKCVFLNKTDARAGLRDMKVATNLVRDGYPMVIFPEGERSMTGAIGSFKKGSFKLALDTKGIIVPVTIRGTREIQRRGAPRVWPKKRVDVIIDKPIEVMAYSRDEQKELDNKVRDIIVAHFDKTDYEGLIEKVNK